MDEQLDGSTPVGDVAADYARSGLHVFPCHSVHGNDCSCGNAECGNIAKHPRTKNGLKDATLESGQIEAWWPNHATCPANIAIAAGAKSGILVIDVDPRHEGLNTLRDLEHELGPLPREWSVTTGGGGRHVYFRYLDDAAVKSRNGWRPGIDIKADGGYVIAPPSVHRSGKRYEWLSHSQPEPPLLPREWLAAIVERSERSSAERTSTADGRALVLQRAQQYAASVPGANEGARNDAAFGLAGHLASFVTDGGDRLAESDIYGVVQSWNARCNPPLADRELHTCVGSALKNGKPRATKEVKVAAEPTAGDDQETAPEQQRKSQATRLVELAGEADLFHDLDGEAFARFPVGEDDNVHWQVARIRTRPFKRWLAQRFYHTEGKVPAAQTQQDAMGVIEAQAVFDGEQRNVSIRLADHDGRIYFDLGNHRWQVVEIGGTGWRILDDSPVTFRRSKAMLSVPMPDPQGDVQEFRRFANVTDEDWPLLLAWLVAAFRPTGPYPVLAIHGEHGSGKSTLCRRLRSLVDPNTSPLRGDYREPRDLMICANSGWAVALDNVSAIQAWLSDCFCRLSTGGGFSTRTLYENDEETIFNATRPLMLNCIDEVVTRSDLLDRCLLVNLPRIDEDHRISEKQLDREFESARPRILGGLLTAVATALRNEDGVKLPRLPRMADFAVWATAAEPALGLSPGQFLSAYENNRAAGNDTAIESSVVGKCILELAGKERHWSGTATQMLAELEAIADEKTVRLKSWPTGARLLGGIVKRLAPNLREAGIDVEFDRAGKRRTRVIELTCRPEQGGNSLSALSVPSAPAESPRNRTVRADDEADANSQADADQPDPDAGPNGLLSAEEAEFSEEHCQADMADEADAEILAQSYEPAWTEI